MEKIKIENLTFTYPNSDTPALSDINISINQGEFVTIFGKSGSGKSTLLRHLKPILAPAGKKIGKIFLEGEDISLLGQREQAEGIGFVMQSPDSQIVCDTVWHELCFSLENLGFSDTQIRAKTAEMSAFFGLSDIYYKNTCDLSGGQKQLLNLASAMILQPSVLILDEPTSQLDPIAAHDFLGAVSKINKELGITVILTEHRLEEALPLSDKAIVMENGVVIADGAPGDVGSALKTSKNALLSCLPTPMKVFYSLENSQTAPITIGDGRNWLSGISSISNPDFSEKFKRPKNSSVKVEDVWFRYEKNAPEVLRGVSLDIREGEIFAIVGGNGAGKSTLLSAIMGINVPLRGKISLKNGKKAALLPQNPQSLFVKNSVLDDLYDVCDNISDEKIQKIIDFCSLGNLLNAHPYDLSGGQMQKLALAKVLLTNPDILLLDEPTKGLDAQFKEQFSGLLTALKNSGMTVLMVSHDIEFCAKSADRIGMFFNGQIVSENSPREFFSENYFYTTAASKMAKGFIKGAVSDEDIISAIGGEKYEKKCEAVPAKKPQPALNPSPPSAPLKKSRIDRHMLISAIVSLLLIPVTILFGMTYFEDRKYYFISLLIILETLLPFAFIFEGRKEGAKKLVILSVLCAIAVTSRIAFASFPYVKPVLALVIISGVCFGAESGFLVGAACAFVSNFYFSQGPWTPWQMFAFGIVGFLSGILARIGVLKNSKPRTAVFGFLSAVLVYGAIMNPASVLMGQDSPTLEMLASSFALGLPFDIIHGASTAVFLWIVYKPMCQTIERIKIKYGI